MLVQGMGGTAFYLICATIVFVILGMATQQWRRLGADDYRRVALASGGIFLGRMIGGLALTIWKADVAWLEWAL